MDMPGADTLDFLTWVGPAIGLMDLDAFFASVETLDHPEWKGKPVIVGGDAQKRGVVSTASYEARRFGVHSAMPSFQARKLCPEAIWTHGHFDRYREMSKQVMSVIVCETPLVEQVSIDEAFFDVTPGRFSNESPIAICRRIQRRVAALGLSCSIGLSTNKTVAKIASERDKPHGLSVILPGTEPSFLAPLSVRAMSGIGSATEQKLAQLGIHTLGQLARQDPDEMSRIFGVMGPRMVARAAGIEHSPVHNYLARDPVKSVSSERTFARDLITTADVHAAVKHVAALTGSRLRKKGLQGCEVTLKLKSDLSHTHTAQRALPKPTDDEHVFGRVALELLTSIWREGIPVRLIGVGVSEFYSEQPEQLSLFDLDQDKDALHDRGDEATDDFSSHERRPERALRKLSDATDEVRRRFGAGAIAYGHDLRLDNLER